MTRGKALKDFCIKSILPMAVWYVTLTAYWMIVGYTS